MGCRPLSPVRHARTGLTIMEVMIALMVFAVLLSAIASNWFTLRSVQRLSQEEAKVHELAQTLSERIVGANWDWIGRDRKDETKTAVIVDDSVVPQTTPPTTKEVEYVERYWRRYAWSWHRREFPRTAGATIRLPPLTDHDWDATDLARLRADTEAPLTAADVDRYDPLQPPAQRINPHNLVDLGVIDRRTGLKNLQVYVEYYQASVLDTLFSKDLASETTPYWKAVTRGQQDEEMIFPESPFESDPVSEQMDPSGSDVALQAMVVRIIVTWGDSPKQQRHELVLARRK